MSDNTEAPGPVDTAAKQPDIAAQIAREAAAAKAPDPAKPEGTQDDARPADATGDEQEHPEGSADSDRDDATATRQNKGVGKRINELTREKHEERRAREAAEQRAADLERRLQALERGEKPQGEPAPQQPQADGRPKLEDFDFDAEAHAEAVAEWKFHQLEQQREARKQAEQRQATLAEREAAFIAEHPDYREVAHAPHVPITREMAEVIVQADDPPAIAYYLGKNLAEAAEISRMSPLAQARAIGRIEMQLAAPKTPAAPPPPPTPVSKAPAPVTPLKASTPASKPLEEMSMAEYVAERNRQEKARAS